MLFCPPSPKGKDIPPTRARRALFPGGKGETKVILCKGLRPLHPRGWAGRGTGERGEPRAGGGRAPYGVGGRGASRCPAEGVPSLPPAYPAFAFFSAPYPPIPLPPSPVGKGEILGYFMQGASPLASPELGGARHWGRGRTTRPAGGVPLTGRGEGASRYPAGVLAFFAACRPCRCFTFLPLSPRPPSRREGGDQGYFMQGASPLASPGFGGTRHWGRGRTTHPAAGVPGWSPANPPFSFLFCPYPPDPLPGGKGETKVISCKGLRPLHPRGWTYTARVRPLENSFFRLCQRPFPSIIQSRKVLGGLGDSFKSPPAFSLFFGLCQRPFPSII